MQPHQHKHEASEVLEAECLACHMGKHIADDEPPEMRDPSTSWLQGALYGGQGPHAVPVMLLRLCPRHRAIAHDYIHQLAGVTLRAALRGTIGAENEGKPS